MFSRIVAAGLMLPALFSLSPVAAAPAFPVRVGGDGRLIIPPSAIRKLKLKQDRGIVAVEFPMALHPRSRPQPRLKPGEHRVTVAQDLRPPRIFTGLRNDGGLMIPPMKMGGRASIPGKPGTRYTATVQAGILVLKPAR